MRVTHLKVKIKSLADEARIIRREEEKALRRAHWKKNRHGGEFDWSEYKALYDHRKVNVGQEARRSLLAYAFLRDVPYAVAEENALKEPHWDEVRKAAWRFDNDGSTFEARWKAWVDAAREHCKAQYAKRLRRLAQLPTGATTGMSGSNE